MEALVLNKEFQAIGVVDVFESFIWTDRYSAYGDFELYMHPSEELMDLLQYDYYLWSEHSEHTMIIEGRKIQTDIEDGDHLTIVGRSLESILTRRVVWKYTELGHYATDEDEREYEEDFQRAIAKLLYENCMPPVEGPVIPERYGDWTCDPDRIIPNFHFKWNGDPRIDEAMTIKAQIQAGANLYDTIKSLCDEKGCGFKIVLNDQNELVFSLYMGEDRSYDQDVNPYVVFSPEYDNLLNSNYFEDYTAYKNAALVIGDDDGDEDQFQAAVTGEGATGLNRREVYVDGSGMSWEDEEGNYYEDDEYVEQLAQMGRETLTDASLTKTFEGEAEYRRTYEYGKDFFIGDIVQLENEYGITATSRIVEMIFSHDGSGESAIPTFTTAEENYGSYSVESGVTGRTTTGKQISDALSNVESIIKANPVTVTKLAVDGITAEDYSLRVYRMAGIAVVTLEVPLTKNFASWTDIAKGLPEPAATWYDTASTWDTSFKRNLRVRVSTSGVLAIHYGVAGSYRISFSYPLIGGSEGGGGGGGGGGGTSNYNELINKPQIEHTTLIGDQTFEDLGLEILTNQEIEEMLT